VRILYRATVYKDDRIQMRHANINTPSSAATYVATGASCRQKPFGLLRSDDNQALAGGCFR
jgi:hypothetical protein